MTQRANLEDKGTRAFLRAAARLARDASLTVRVVPAGNPAATAQARDAAEEAGVDLEVHGEGAHLVVHFIARHQDRAIRPPKRGALVATPAIRVSRPPEHAPGVLDQLPVARATLASRHARVPAGVAGRTQRGARIVDLETYHEIVEALGLEDEGDAEAQAIADRLARASPQAHVCDGVPALVVDEIRGLVGPLRRRAEQRGIALKVNPDDCACMTH